MSKYSRQPPEETEPPKRLPPQMLRRLNSGQPIAVISRARRGGEASGPPKSRRQKNGHSTEILWNSYGVPMEYLWNFYGTSREQQAGIKPATRLRRAQPRRGLRGTPPDSARENPSPPAGVPVGEAPIPSGRRSAQMYLPASRSGRPVRSQPPPWRAPARRQARILLTYKQL